MLRTYEQISEALHEARQLMAGWSQHAQKRWLQMFRSWVGCAECGERHPAVLDYHHRDRDKKIDTPLAVLSRDGWDAALREVAKCDVLCSYCHRKKHWSESRPGINVKTWDYLSWKPWHTTTPRAAESTGRRRMLP